MVALPDADGQDFIRNERPTRYRGGFVLKRVSDVQLAKERKCTSYGVFWLGIIVDGYVYACPGEGIILCTIIYWEGIELVLWEGRFWEHQIFYQHIVVTVGAVGEKDTNVKSKDTCMLHTRVSYCGIYYTRGPPSSQAR
jgi:hypothetical protein